MMPKVLFFVAALHLLLFNFVHGQERQIQSEVLKQDTSRQRIKLDTAAIDTPLERLDPVKAALLSAVLPGLGQAYNGSYWKIPIVYGGLFALAATVQYFDYNYVKFRNVLLAEDDGNPNTVNPYQDLLNRRTIANALSSNRRNRDYFMIITSLFYLLNVVEAHVDAHLQDFDITDDLTFKVEPSIQNFAYSYQLGISLKLQLK
ncbi:MAG: DUF5683 domain-containing protein [Candidatus Cyclobacteriaceae bacterium M3_2C_046]